MGDLYRRLLRIILMCIGSYFSLSVTIKDEHDISGTNFAKTVLVIAIIFMVIDNYIPRVHLHADIREHSTSLNY